MTPKEALEIIKRSIQNLEYNDILDQEALLTISKVIIEFEELTAELARYFTLTLKRDSKWSTGLSKEEEKELVNIEYKIISMLSENTL